MIKFKEWIKKDPKLEEFWNTIPEPVKTIFEIQIDVFVYKQMPKALLEEWLDYINQINISPPIEETEDLLNIYLSPPIEETENLLNEFKNYE